MHAVETLGLRSALERRQRLTHLTVGLENSVNGGCKCEGVQAGRVLWKNPVSYMLCSLYLFLLQTEAKLQPHPDPDLLPTLKLHTPEVKMMAPNQDFCLTSTSHPIQFNQLHYVKK